jgi:hypothetical protein
MCFEKTRGGTAGFFGIPFAPGYRAASLTARVEEGIVFAARYARGSAFSMRRPLDLEDHSGALTVAARCGARLSCWRNFRLEHQRKLGQVQGLRLT